MDCLPRLMMQQTRVRALFEVVLQPLQTLSLTEEASCVTGDSVLASALCASVREARSLELPLVERQEAPEVVALRANMQRLRLLKERMSVCTKVDFRFHFCLTLLSPHCF